MPKRFPPHLPKMSRSLVDRPIGSAVLYDHALNLCSARIIQSPCRHASHRGSQSDSAHIFSILSCVWAVAGLSFRYFGLTALIEAPFATLSGLTNSRRYREYPAASYRERMKIRFHFGVRALKRYLWSINNHH